MDKEVKIPDIAENVDTGLIAGILVSEGDEVKKDQPLVEVETDKATTDIPSEHNGKVKEIKVKEGDEVKVHQVIMILEVSESGDVEEEKNGREQKEDSTEEKSDPGEAGKKQKKKGDEKKTDEDKESEKEVEDPDEEKPGKKEKSIDESSEDKRDDEIPASPLARRIARENGLDISAIKGSGPGGRISRFDVENHIEAKKEEKEKEKDVEEYEKEFAGVRRESMSTIDKITAATMIDAWKNIPQVTQFDEADITEIEEFRKNNQERIAKHGGKLTITSILLKLSAFAFQKFPRFNASLDWENQEIVYKQQYHISIAVDTPQGLLVPVVKDVNMKSLAELSVELSELSEKARNKKISPDEMKGGNFTISNLGGIGGTAFTPIVYPPQVAILGVSRADYRQRLINDEFEKRLIMPLSLTYDHRIINGADGARFLRWFCEVLEDPYTLFF